MISLILAINLIAVDVKGEVNNPGVIITEPVTINDIIQLAGGLTENADTEFINLARSVIDEMVIYIPNINNRIGKTCDCPPMVCLPPVIPTTQIITTTKPITTSIPITAPAIIEEANDELININTANKEELMTIRGVGEVIASRIIAFREATPFITIYDILNVSGIGERIFESIRESISVD